MKEVEAGGSEIHGHSQLHRGFEANLGYVSKKKKKSKEVVLEDQRFSARLKTSWWGWGGETEKKN